MKIQREEDPTRFGVFFPKTNTQVICQLMEDDLDGPDRIIIGEVKVSAMPKAKLRILLSTPLPEFLDKFGDTPFLALAEVAETDFSKVIEKAFQQYIFEKYNIKPELS